MNDMIQEPRGLRWPGSDLNQHAAKRLRTTERAAGDNRVMIARLRARPEIQLAGVLPQADFWLATGWWTVLMARGLLPAVLAIATGAVLSAAEAGRPV